MKITKFKKVGKNKYKVFFNNTDLTLYEDIILKYKCKYFFKVTVN